MIARRAAGRRSGHTLIELLIALSVLLIAMGGVTMTTVRNASLRRASRERAMAMEAAMSVIDDLRSAEFGEVFALYNADPGDEALPGTGPGDRFQVQGLRTAAGDPDVGTILFPGDGFELREDFVDRELGMPRDLTLDDPPAIDGLDHGDDYRILPVRVRVRWRGAGGAQVLELVTSLTEETE